MAEETTIRQLSAFEGQEVTIRGWLYGKRRGGKILFLLVRDGTGLCQCVAEAGQPDVFHAASEVTQESALRVSGRVQADSRAVGGYEIAIGSVELIQQAVDFPITRKAHGIDFLMAHRHLWLRSPRQVTILRIRHTLIKAIRCFFDDRGFTLIDTPILVPGAGEDTQSLFPVDYFGEKAFLTQTGQLHLEAACMALRKVYCFGPTFRAEKSKTRRHLTEFWMVEPEVAFAELDEVMALAEDLVCSLVEAALCGHEDDLASLGRDIEPLKRVQKPFPRITYSEAVESLRSEKTRNSLEDERERDLQSLQRKIEELRLFEEQVPRTDSTAKLDQLQKVIFDLKEEIGDLERDLAAAPEHMRLAQSFQWGKDLGGSDETILSRQFEKPVFVTNYPAEAKAFYMKVSRDDRRVVRNMDLLAPEGYGEIVGGSQREESMERLLDRMTRSGLDPNDYAWYLDLRRYGSVPHGGFGLGVERTLSWICGLKHVREAIPFPRLMGKLGV